MFDISFTEILIISVVALIVIGPERLPQVARTLGHLFGRARGYAASIKTDIHNEIRLEELKNLHASMQETAQSIKHSVRQEIDQLKSVSNVESASTSASVSSHITEISTESPIQPDLSVPSPKPASQEQAIETGETRKDILDKANK